MKKLLFVLGFLTALAANAQVNGEEKLGAWYMYFGTNKVADKWSIHTEAQFRFWEVASNFNQMLLRTGMNYHISDEAIATLGYAYISTDTNFDEFPGEENTRENRIFQQFILKNKVGKFAFEHRYRLEQRFLDLNTESRTEHRARYRLQVTLPVSRVFFLNVYNEFFLNLQGSVFGQNRLYGAVGFNLSKISNIQFGYLKNHFPSAHYDRLQLAIFINPDFRKKTKDGS